MTSNNSDQTIPTFNSPTQRDSLSLIIKKYEAIVFNPLSTMYYKLFIVQTIQ